MWADWVQQWFQQATQPSDTVSWSQEQNQKIMERNNILSGKENREQLCLDIVLTFTFWLYNVLYDWALGNAL